MPTYVYQVILDDGSEGEMFEVEQHMDDEALKTHPETGQPVQRVFQAPNLAFGHTMRHDKSSLDNDRVEKLGFTKYVKDKSSGTYHREVGKGGPDTLDPRSVQ